MSSARLPRWCSGFRIAEEIVCLCRRVSRLRIDKAEEVEFVTSPNFQRGVATGAGIEPTMLRPREFALACGTVLAGLAPFHVELGFRVRCVSSQAFPGVHEQIRLHGGEFPHGNVYLLQPCSRREQTIGRFQ